MTFLRVRSWACQIAFMNGLLILAGAATRVPTEQVRDTSDVEVAARLGINVQEAQRIRSQFQLSSSELLALPPAQLRSLQWQLDHPGRDPDEAARKWRGLRMRDELGRIPPNALIRAFEQRKRVGLNARLFPPSRKPAAGPLIAGIQTNGWIWLGPGNVGGRVRSILVHPTSTNVLWCGGVSGGIWKTTNSGAAWFPCDDFMANLAVCSLAMDPANPDVIYAGTGEDYYPDAIRGAGIFKTTNGGAAWSQLPSTATESFYCVSGLAIDPGNGSNILAATRSGIWRSEDGGASWTQRTVGDTLFVSFHPTDGSKAIASAWGSSAWYSSDGGSSWNDATGIVSTGSALEVAYSRADPNTVFAYNANVYRSMDGGQTFTYRGTIAGQGGTPIALWCDPVNTNNLIAGNVDLYRSINAGATFTKISDWTAAPPYGPSVHADHQIIIHSPAFNGTTVCTVFFGNDGGVYVATNVYTVGTQNGWRSLNNNLGITQFYGGAGNSNTSVIVGGTQDNGTTRYAPAGSVNGWTYMYGGDGGFCAADETNTNYFYGEYVALRIHRSINGGYSSSYIYNGISDTGSAANFLAPFILDPNNMNTMLAGGARLWRTTNVKFSVPFWLFIKPAAASYISAIAVAPGNSDVIWVGHNDGAVYSTTNGTGIPTWTQRGAGTLPGRYCGRIAIAPGDPNRVYVVFGGFSPDNVWRTSDGGLTWSNITGNLPAAPMNSIVVARADRNVLYLGSEVGVFGSSTGGDSWSTGNDGPANVAIDELFWLGNKLVAVTHGRGMFSIIPDIGNHPPVVTTASVFPASPTTTNDLQAVVESASDPDGDPIIFRYEWQESGTNLVGQTSSNLLAGATFAGGLYRCVITPNDGQIDGTPFPTAAVPVPVDSDGNGINDDWEVQYFGQIGIDPNADPLGKGMSNYQQFLAGLNPTNPSSLFRIISIVSAGAAAPPSGLLVTWQSGGGKTNIVEAADVMPTNFTDLSGPIAVLGNGDTTTNFLDAGGTTNASSRFYRIRLVP